MSVCCECCVLSGRGLCVELVPRLEEVWSWSLWKTRRPRPPRGCRAIEKKNYITYSPTTVQNIRLVVVKLTCLIQVFCDATRRDAVSLVSGCRLFRRVVVPLTSEVQDCFTLRMKPVVRSFQTFTITHPTTQRHILQDFNLQHHRCENLKCAFST
jgi:hypothetical protein